MVEKAIYRSMEALKNRDLELAKQVIADDSEIDRKRFDIEEKCIELIVTQQPVASDLRIIVAVLNIIIDLERMGDHAEGIGKITLMIGKEPPLKPLIDLPRMAQKTGDMLRRSLDAFVSRRQPGRSPKRMMRLTPYMTRCFGSCLPSWQKTPEPSPELPASSG
jgi:phosphate transport system protein